MLRLFSKIDKILGKIEFAIMCASGFGLFAVIFTGVVLRYIFSYSLAWAPEIDKLLYIWLVFLGSSYLISKNGHPRVEFLTDKVRKLKNQMLMKLFFTFAWLIMLGFIGAVAYYALIRTPNYLTQKTIVLRISTIFVYGGATVGLCLMFLRSLMKAAQIWLGGEIE